MKRVWSLPSETFTLCCQTGWLFWLANARSGNPILHWHSLTLRILSFYAVTPHTLRLSGYTCTSASTISMQDWPNAFPCSSAISFSFHAVQHAQSEAGALCQTWKWTKWPYGSWCCSGLADRDFWYSTCSGFPSWIPRNGMGLSFQSTCTVLFVMLGPGRDKRRLES